MTIIGNIAVSKSWPGREGRKLLYTVGKLVWTSTDCFVKKSQAFSTNKHKTLEIEPPQDPPVLFWAEELHILLQKNLGSYVHVCSAHIS